MSGTVVMQHGDAADRIAASVNSPVAAGDYITTGPDSRTEVQLDDTDYIRAAAQTQMRVTQLDANGQNVQLAAGTLELSALRHPDSHPQIQTPSITIRPYEAGRYRVTVAENGDTLVTVRAGSADLIGPQGTQHVGAGITLLVTGSASEPRIQEVETIAYDDFDAWDLDRDRAVGSALASASYATSSYANSSIVGLVSLNGYGSWNYWPAYGNVWVPYGQVAGWSPYRWGRWAWQPYCGYTWIGYEPWGWAPYHYGRWFYAPGFGWAWYPGPPLYHYYWQPALVAFFGFGYGGGFGFGFSFGNIGWVPLAPYEPYYPWSRVARPVAISAPVVARIPDIARVYKNANAPGGIEAISGGELAHPGRYDYLQVHGSDLRNFALVKSGMPVAPPTMRAMGQPVTTAWNRFSQPVTGWGRFGSANDQTVTVVHSADGTRTFIGNAAGTRELQTMPVAHITGPAVRITSPMVRTTEPVARVTDTHINAVSSPWNRFTSPGSVKPAATLPSVTRAVGPSTNAQEWTTPVMHTSTSGMTSWQQWAPNAYNAYNGYQTGRGTQWTMPRTYMPSPNGARTYYNAGPMPGHAGGYSMPNMATPVNTGAHHH